MDLQEAIIRGRFVFNNAPKRLDVFDRVNGTLSAKDISRKVGKSLISTLNDLKKISDLDLIKPKKDSKGNILRKNKSIVYEKNPLLKAIPISYFTNQEKGQAKVQSKTLKTKSKQNNYSGIATPSEKQILDICKNGEDQLYEFKESGVVTEKIAREIAAFLNTKNGGILFYGVDDSGSILGSDKTRQKFDQSVQNSLQNNIKPSPIVKIVEKNVMGQNIILIITPPWNKKDVYHFQGKVLIRKGTNVFGVSPEESKKLHKGEYII